MSIFIALKCGFRQQQVSWVLQMQTQCVKEGTEWSSETVQLIRQCVWLMLIRSRKYPAQCLVNGLQLSDLFERTITNWLTVRTQAGFFFYTFKLINKVNLKLFHYCFIALECTNCNSTAQLDLFYTLFCFLFFLYNHIHDLNMAKLNTGWYRDFQKHLAKWLPV